MPKYLIEGELGIPHDELESAIRILEEADFCRFYDDEYVFVFNMARYQIADALNPESSGADGAGADCDSGRKQSS